MISQEKLTSFLNCIGRELGMRSRVYPKWVQQKRMTEKTANYEIKIMSEIYEFFKQLKEKTENLNV